MFSPLRAHHGIPSVRFLGTATAGAVTSRLTSVAGLTAASICTLKEWCRLLEQVGVILFEKHILQFTNWNLSCFSNNMTIEECVPQTIWNLPSLIVESKAIIAITRPKEADKMGDFVFTLFVLYTLQVTPISMFWTNFIALPFKHNTSRFSSLYCFSSELRHS